MQNEMVDQNVLHNFTTWQQAIPKAQRTPLVNYNSFRYKPFVTNQLEK